MFNKRENSKKYWPLVLLNIGLKISLIVNIIIPVTIIVKHYEKLNELSIIIVLVFMIHVNIELITEHIIRNAEKEGIQNKEILLIVFGILSVHLFGIIAGVKIFIDYVKRKKIWKNQRIIGKIF